MKLRDTPLFFRALLVTTLISGYLLFIMKITIGDLPLLPFFQKTRPQVLVTVTFTSLFLFVYISAVYVEKDELGLVAGFRDTTPDLGFKTLDPRQSDPDGQG